MVKRQIGQTQEATELQAEKVMEAIRLLKLALDGCYKYLAELRARNRDLSH